MERSDQDNELERDQSRSKSQMITNPSLEMKIIQNNVEANGQPPKVVASSPNLFGSKMEPIEIQQTLGFDVNQISLYRKYEVEMTKKSIRAIKQVIELLQTGLIAELSFEWLSLFKDSIFSDELSKNIVPFLITLKKYCMTDEKNISLR